MAVRDLFWGCPFCRAPGSIRKAGWRERCMECQATFRRGRRASIVGGRDGSETVASAAEWLARLGPVQVPAANPAGRIIGPELVRVKQTTGQRPYYAGQTFLGWIETYDEARKGTLELRLDGLHFSAFDGSAAQWPVAGITGLQPASSTIQLGQRGSMVSLKFIEGSVRLWTAAISSLIRDHHERQGYDVLVLQPHIRVCRAAPSTS